MVRLRKFPRVVQLLQWQNQNSRAGLFCARLFLPPWGLPAALRAPSCLPPHHLHSAVRRALHFPTRAFQGVLTGLGQNAAWSPRGVGLRSPPLASRSSPHALPGHRDCPSSPLVSAPAWSALPPLPLAGCPASFHPLGRAQGTSSERPATPLPSASSPRDRAASAHPTQGWGSGRGPRPLRNASATGRPVGHRAHGIEHGASMFARRTDRP